MLYIYNIRSYITRHVDSQRKNAIFGSKVPSIDSIDRKKEPLGIHMDAIIRFFRASGGYARMRDLKKRSFHPRDISRLVQRGTLEKVKPGLYRLAELENSSGVSTTLIDVCHAVPQGIVCLASALAYHELTTHNPSEVHIAIPNSAKPQKLPYPPVRFFYFRERFYRPGIAWLKTATNQLRVYNREKTVCDMFRYRKKLGEDLALEGLKNYLKLKQANVNKLKRYAEICQVKTVMMPYLKAILG
jgi:predicted transcriptional regulator of viral defense system